MNKKSEDIQDLKDEMKAHLISAVEELKANGYSEEESIGMLLKDLDKQMKLKMN